MLIPAAPNNCLDNIKQSWPRKGIVRVEVIRSWSEYNEYMDYMKKSKFLLTLSVIFRCFRKTRCDAFFVERRIFIWTKIFARRSEKNVEIV